MKIPGPDHPIAVAPNPRRVVIRAGGHILADTKRALTLTEASYPAVQYVPRDDVDMSLLVRSQHTTFCPYKGEASYYSIRVAGENVAENAVWSYEQPYAAVAAIGGHLAFYPQHVDSIEGFDE